jgi:type VI secretion system protein ImpK
MEPSTSRSTRNLALVLQEVLTAIVRLRANPQTVSDADSFRAQMISALRNVEAEGRQKGYSGDDMRLAIFAVVAFLDESVLNSRSAIFSSWPRKPLQEEMFGGHVAGETFFVNVEQLLKANDSVTVADVLEVYQLCLLLGYQGRYTLGNRGELQATKQAIAEKIRRIRGPVEFSPGWAPAAGSVPRVQNDSIVRRLLYAAVACAVLCVLLFLVFKLTLSSGVSSIRDLSSQSAAVIR